MWGPLAAQTAAQLDPVPTAASNLANSALWSQSAGWDGGATLHQSQHLSTLAPRLSEPGQGSWSGLPQSLQHPVAVAGLFTPFGDVLDVKLYAAEVRLSGGSAVVRMRSTVQAAAAISALNGVVPEGGWQQLTVRAAETAEQRSSRITAINGRQSTGGGMGLGAGHPHSPLQALGAPGGASLPPAGPGAAASAALRRVHSARGSGSQGSLQCYTGGVVGEGGGLPPQRHSADWARDGSMDSSRRSSMDAMRSASAAYGRCSSESGSGGDGSGSEELAASEGGASVGPSAEAQRMLLEAVLALVGQVEGGQLSLGAMRSALESALVAAKHSPAGSDQPSLLQSQGGGGGGGGRSPTAAGIRA
ncbi:hypothetical protein CHLNCDRAFT_142360 [Chlorella variabilis]|uniref:Ig-like domain-containing protein n=1 Tax=Chlorella variabilis TaxID=554065 RepID=E1Z8D4_CHLVA|nr:hypothetical protein CHLNCDRAFT_142360 [Chlorella variabilis]EFN58074.1 hypothetical protein CHLNCDRAFT_142360 [Chlorella variabilis]|eukprot:XP_005850176.1 hypothetical protein CHLNCDRAFT_142360 [Chlorella variabilis]